MAVCNKTALLILYCVISRLVNLLKVTDAPIQVCVILCLTARFKLINFTYQIFLLFVLAISASFTSDIVPI